MGVIKVGVFGAAGRMGSTVCDAVLRDPATELVAAVDPHHEGLDVKTVTAPAETTAPATTPAPAPTTP